MSHTPAYDALETVAWMLDEARAELARETYATDEGRTRRTTRARRAEDFVRFETLCAVIWSVNGRAEPLEQVAERALAAAA